MKLSTKGRYGLFAMYYLAQHQGEGPQPLKAVAQAGVPEDYLEQLLALLRRSGLINTVRGAQGGYQLAKAPAEITVGDILNATEGPVTICDCIEDSQYCSLSGECRSRRVWQYLADSIDQLLGSISLQTMLEQDSFSLPGKENQA